MRQQPEASPARAPHQVQRTPRAAVAKAGNRDIAVEYGSELVLTKGGVFDYREFDTPPGRALTREEFRGLMDSPDAPPPPAWTRSYRVERAPARAGSE